MSRSWCVSGANKMPDSSPWTEVDIDLHPKAAQRTRQYVYEYALALVMQAKTLAFSKRAQEVTPTHIDQAFDILNDASQRARLKLIAIILGSALFGAFVQGFVSEISAGQAFLIAANAGMGFVGLFIALWGLRR